MFPGIWVGKLLFEHCWTLSQGLIFRPLTPAGPFSGEQKSPRGQQGMGWVRTALLWVSHSAPGSPVQRPGRGVQVEGPGFERPPRASYLIEVSHIFTVLQHPGVEGLPWVGKEDKKRGSDLSTWHSP